LQDLQVVVEEVGVAREEEEKTSLANPVRKMRDKISPAKSQIPLLDIFQYK